MLKWTDILYITLNVTSFLFVFPNLEFFKKNKIKINKK